jgi:hypothetical protein
MTNEPSSYPCKSCGHPEQAHFIFEENYGGWVWDDNVGHEVWVEEQQPRPVCDSCGSDCIFEQMTNLEYLEWKYDQLQNPL